MADRVSTKIYGQEYVISGGESKEHIEKVAEYVDTKMHEVAQAVKGAQNATIAVLAAVNISDELHITKKKLEEQCKLTDRLEKDASHYVQLWEEAKKNFAKYKEEASNVSRQKDELTSSLREKDKEIQNLKGEALSAAEERQKITNAEKEELEIKCKELENNFFDLQMENIRLKSEIERMKKNLGE